jgi:NADH-quinone oxidoreductase subunit N
VSGASTLLLAAPQFHTPNINYFAISPILIVLGMAAVGVLVEAFAPAAQRWLLEVVVSLTGLVGALIATIVIADSGVYLTARDAVAVDGPSLYLWGTILVISIASVLLVAERSAAMGGSAFTPAASQLPGSVGERTLAAGGRMQTEVFPLFLLAVGGMLLFPASNSLLLMFVALEVLSLPLYLMCGLARRRRLLSQEAALKYFLLGAFSSAFFLYGLALLYGYANTDLLSGIHDAVQTAAQNDSLLYLGLGLLGMGLLFKVGAAPFQVWIPDVYHGAPTPITAFMAAATKVAAFGALLRVLYVGFGPLTWDWRPILWAVAILTMIIGAVFAVTQQDLKRMLAYSSIAHAGFVLVGVIAASSRGLSGSLFYLLTYGVTTVGAFGILALVRDADGEATHLSRWAGLGKRAPLLAGVVTLFLLSLAGIPLTSGFAGKYAVFLAGIDGGATPVVIVALVMSAVTAFFYIRVIVLMYFSDPVAVGPTIVLPGVFTAVALAMAVAVTVVLGVYPDPFLHLARDAVPFVR